MADGDGVLAMVRRGEPVTWLREGVAAADRLGTTEAVARIAEARARFARFRRPLSLRLGDGGWDGEICSALLDWPEAPAGARILVKADHALPMTGSIKARGGVHEVLKFIERIALAHGLIEVDEDYAVLAGEEAAGVLSDYTVSVGSTGNLGFSIGLVARAFGLGATVHMSRDAKEWKKARLRDLGAAVVEHSGDYGAACAAARAAMPADDRHHFVDDEASPDLFWGYAVAAGELAEQLRARDIHPSSARPLVVYLPCGVGGAPGGITCGLKTIFGSNVICIFVEPTASPCMLSALAGGPPYDDPPSIYDLGLDNQTVADGLAVAQASSLALELIGDVIDGAVTVSDQAMLVAAADAWRLASLRLEPSAAAGLAAIAPLLRAAARRSGWPRLDEAVHVAWATGGSMLPDAEWHAQLVRADEFAQDGSALRSGR